MPNHVTNWVEITDSQEAIAKLKQDTIKTTTPTFDENNLPEDSGVEFDFNGIIKMPEELRATRSPVKIVDTQEEADKINGELAKEDDPFNKDETTIAITSAEHIRRLQAYDANDWYDWAIKHWGTKWGSYEVSILKETDTKLVLRFQTAWSTPEPIFDELTKRGYTVNCFWQDEEPSNMGEYGDPYSVFDIDISAVVEYIGE